MSDESDLAQDRQDLDLLLRGFQVSRMLRLVADLGVADKVARNGVASIHDLAAACGVHPEPLTRVLRALASFRIFQVSADLEVSHSPRSLLLRTDTPGSMHHAARFWTAPGSWRAWGELDAAMSGGSPHEAAWHMDRFAYLRQHPDEARIFDVMMANFPDDRHAAIAEAYDFSGARVIADMGGGNGAALRHILERFPAARGVLFDREDTIAALKPADLMDGRISAEGGSFFDAVPHGADIQLLIRVLHNWSDDDCCTILRKCREGIAAGGRLLLGEHILEPDPLRGRPTEYLLDTQMMAMFGHARERTEAQFRDLLDRSGFALTRALRTRSPVSLVEAKPVA